MTVKLLIEQHLELVNLTGGCIGSPESALVKMPHCWKLHVAAHFNVLKVYEPRHEISKNVFFATSKDSDQPAHTRSLIRAFASRLTIL